MSNTKQLPPELVDKCKEELSKRLGLGVISKATMLDDYYIASAQIAVDYAEEEKKELIDGIKEIKELILSIDGKHLSFDDLKGDILKEIKQLLKKHENGK